ncbi:MAG: tRNA 2-selenouridine(34) synthase MnmH [Bacteroidia bacterium]|nr:tRNA 2-selenouridine(34) synthase MnmH [Bacteroidia bacterium]
MQVQSLEADQFLNDSIEGIVLDVRSPAEYKAGHIPGAISFPLFTDDERKQVGTLYKYQGKEPAVELGLEIVGPKLKNFVQHAREYAGNKPIYLHCWRGGMRSNSMAWLLRTAGLHVYTLMGGYKAYRKYLLNYLTNSFRLVVLGGETGSGKTEVLQALRSKNQQVIDLEDLACHKGSSFGSIGKPQQPTTEQFTNMLFHELSKLDITKPVWVEDESRMIGTVNIPEEFFLQMSKAPLLVMKVPAEWRVANLVKGYGEANKELLVSAFKRIQKKLGGQHLQAALQALDDNNLETAAIIALRYYDKAYRFGLQTKVNLQVLHYEPQENSVQQMAGEILTLAQNNFKNVWTVSN